MKCTRAISLNRQVKFRVHLAALSACIAATVMQDAARADVAVVANESVPSSFALGLNFSAGWRFTVAADINITHLGLYDWQGDGFEISHPVGLWNGSGELITEVDVPAGTTAPFLNGFRYVSLETLAPVVLSPGEIYTIGYFQSTLSLVDRVIHFNGAHVMHPSVNQVGGGFVTGNPSPGLAFPDQVFLEFPQWFGPSFQFTVVPGPASWLILGLAGLARFRRRE